MTHPGPLPSFGQEPISPPTSVNGLRNFAVSQAAASTNTVDFIVAPQDDPQRPAVYASGDLYTMLATSPETDFAFNAFDFFAPANW